MSTKRNISDGPTIEELAKEWEQSWIPKSERSKIATQLGRLTGRTGKAIMETWNDRRQARMGTPPSLQERLHDRLLADVLAEMNRRGLETSIETEQVRIWDRKNGFRLVGVDGFRRYGKQSWAASLRYLYGVDDNGPWVRRVTGSCQTVADAIHEITPSEVRKAQDAGRQIFRQGDVWAIETAAKHDGNGLHNVPRSHRWDHESRVMTHEPDDDRAHQPLHIDIPVRWAVTPDWVSKRGRSGD